MIPTEVEAKLTLTRARDAKAIAGLRELGPYRLRVLSTKRLQTTYLDTPTFSLARNGLAVRIRRDGDAWELTAKWGGKIAGAVHERAELTVALSQAPTYPFTPPPGLLATRLTALLAGAAVSPIFSTEIVRQRRAIIAGDAVDAPIAELDLDRVILRRPQGHRAHAPYWEVEVERQHGTHREIVLLARLLRRKFALVPSPESKFTHGLRVLHPKISWGEPAGLVAGTDSVRTAARKAVARHLARLLRHDPGVRDGNDPDAIHDMRVAVRRLRAVLRAFRAGFPKSLRRTLKDELDWLAQVLGDVRDIDVQLAHLSRQKESRRGPALAIVRQHLLGQRKRRGGPLQAALKSPRYIQLITALDAFVIDERPDGGNKTAARHGARALRKSLRRLRHDGRHAMQDPTSELLHALRISAKRVRYGLELVKEMTARPGARLTKALVAVQDMLGMQHDAVVALHTTHGLLAQRENALKRADLASLRTFAATQERDAEKFRRRAQALWKRSRPHMMKDMHATFERLDHAEVAAEE